MQGTANPLYVGSIPARASKLMIRPGGGMVYTKDLKSFDRKVMRVRLPPRAQLKNTHNNLRVFFMSGSRFYLNGFLPWMSLISIKIMAITSSTCIKPPNVNAVKRPNNHKTIRTMAMTSRIIK